jgi:hypothetical protein
MFSIQPCKENEIGYRVMDSYKGYYNIPNKKLAALMANTLNCNDAANEAEINAIFAAKGIFWNKKMERWYRNKV